MKKFLLSVLLLIPFWVKAQVYHPLVDSGAVWNVEEEHCDFFNGFCLQHCDYLAEKFFLGSDTIIQNQTYKIIWGQSTYGGSLCDEVLSVGNFDPDPEMIGAIREDSSKRVWFFWFCNQNLGLCPVISQAQEADYLLYDFSLQVGDTILYPDLYGTTLRFVIGIDSIQLLNGQWNRQYHFQDGESMVEQIGFEEGLFFPFKNYFECGGSLTCYRSQSELLFHGETNFGHINCDSISGIEGIPADNAFIAISPNPASDFLNINFSSPIFFSAQIKITDVLGRNLFSGEIKSNQPLQIETEKFSGNNMLFCELWQDGKLIGVKKIIIQK